LPELHETGTEKNQKDEGKSMKKPKTEPPNASHHQITALHHTTKIKHNECDYRKKRF
jgi:hypothetical protein